MFAASIVGAIALLPLLGADVPDAASSRVESAPRVLPGRADCSKSVCSCPWHDVISLDDFVVLPEEQTPSQKARCRWQSECQWQLFRDAQGLAIYHTEPPRDAVPVDRKDSDEKMAWEGYGLRRVLEVEDGWIVALDVGEFGAGLWWIAKDGRRQKKLGEPHVVALIRTKVGVFAATGLDHGIPGRGEVLLIKKRHGGDWQSKHFAFVGDSAKTAIAAPDGGILVVTRTSLVHVSFGGKAKILHRGKWSEFFDTGHGTFTTWHPGSVAVESSGKILLGMNGAIVRLTPTDDGYQEDWLMPSVCRDLRRAGALSGDGRRTSR